MNINEFLEEISQHEEILSEEAKKFIEDFKEKNSTFTENGRAILKIMQENSEKYMNVFSSKQIGELLLKSPRAISGSMKKLITDGYVEKKSKSPVTYGLTELAKTLEFDKE